MKFSKCPEAYRRQIKPCHTIIRGITPDAISILGSCQIPYYFDKQPIFFETYILNDTRTELATDGILSRNFLNDNQIYLRGQNDYVVYQHKAYKLRTYRDVFGTRPDTTFLAKVRTDPKPQSQQKHSGKTCPPPTSSCQKTPVKVRASETINLAPSCGTYVQLTLSTPLDGNYIFNPTNEFIKNWDIQICNSIHKLHNEQTIILFIFNAANTETTLNKNAILGQLLPITAHNLNLVMEASDAEFSQPAEPSLSVATCEIHTGEILDEETDISALLKRIPKDRDVTKLIDTQHLNRESRGQLLQLIREFKDIFWLPGDKLTVTPRLTAQIETGNNQPVSKRPYRTAEKLLQPLRNEIEDLLEQDIIRPSMNSPWNSPCMLLSKKIDGKIKYRLVIDFRELNKLTAPITCPFPEVFRTLTKAAGADYFSSLDCVRAFHQIPLRDEDKPKTAFTCDHGVFEFNRLAFGLKNAAIIFQQLMDQLLTTRTNGSCQVFLDDILVHSKEGIKDHIKQLRTVFQVLRDANLKLRPDKCKFFQTEVKYLGFRVSKTGYYPDDAKIQIIKDYPRPATHKNVKQFLGVTGFFRRHCPAYAQTALPLTQLTSPRAKFQWTDECENAFKKLKHDICQQATLAFPLYDGTPFQVYCDASNHALGAVLTQVQNGQNVPLAFASRKLNDAERKYPTYRREILAVIFAIKQFKHYLTGQQFKVYTDHKPLTYILTSKNLKSVLERYALFLSEYTFEIIYLPGALNTIADGCSRILVDNGNITYLPEDQSTHYESYDEFLEKWLSKQKTVHITTVPPKQKLKREKHALTERKVAPQIETNAYDQRQENETSWTNRSNNKVQKSLRVKVSPTEEQTRSTTKKNQIDVHTVNESLRQKHVHQTMPNRDTTHPNIAQIDKASDTLGQLVLKLENLTFRSRTDKTYLQMDDDLTKLLLQVDDIDTHGDEQVQQRRKKLVQQIHHVAELLEDIVDSHITKENVSQSQKKNILLTDPIKESPNECNKIAPPQKVEIDLESISDSHSEDSESSVNSEAQPEIFRHEAYKIAEHATEVNKDDPLWVNKKSSLRSKIIHEQKTDTRCQQIVKQFDTMKHKQKLTRFKRDQDGLLYRFNKDGNPCAYIPDKLQNDTIRNYHEDMYIGHPGATKLLKLMQKSVYFPKMLNKIKEVISHCTTCLKTKPFTQPVKADLQLYKLPQRPMQEINMDFFGPIFSTYDPDNLKYGLVIICRFSHWPEVYSLEDMTASSVIKVLMEKFIPTHGTPLKIVTDQQKTFVSEQFRSFCTQFNIQLRHTTAFRPQSNGMAESTVKKVKQIISSLAADKPATPWYKFLPYALAAVRNSVNAATQMTPFQILYGRHMTLPLEAPLKYSLYVSDENTPDREFATWNHVWQTVTENTELYQDKYQQRENTKAKHYNFQIGQKVYLKQMAFNRHYSKIYQDKYTGPFIIRTLSNVTATIEDVNKPKKFQSVHVNRLRPVKMKPTIADREEQTTAKKNAEDSDDESVYESAEEAPVASKQSDKMTPTHPYRTRLQARLNPEKVNESLS